MMIRSSKRPAPHSRRPLGFDGADNYSTVPSAMPNWMADPSTLPRKSVAQVVAEQRQQGRR